MQQFKCRLDFASLTTVILAVVPIPAWSVVSCPGGGFCPEHNTCCPTPYGHSSCITGKPKPDHMGPSFCCHDDDGIGMTGCGPGYLCGSYINPADGTDRPSCVLRDHIEESPKLLPRYKLCHLPNVALLQVHGLVVHQTNSDGIAPSPQLAYHSTMQSIDSNDQGVLQQQARVRIALVIIHGSGRNADDYLCCATASLPKQVDPSSILILAPRFLANRDGPVNITGTVRGERKVLRWNETHPIPHTWRYGADAIDANVSSYDAIDTLLERLAFDVVRFPMLQQVIVAGHSAGGQFTQRWALTSSSLAWGDDDTSTPPRTLPIRVVVANPRSFCYLDDKRYVNGSLVTPSSSAVSSCPGYNKWEWGLDSGGRLLTPYKDRALIKVGGQGRMVERYKSRDVVYLAGDLDVEPINGSCEDDDFQGATRRERSELFFSAMKEIYGKHEHSRLVASGVPHDHCLVFQSPAGQNALFGNLDSDQGQAQS